MTSAPESSSGVSYQACLISQADDIEDSSYQDEEMAKNFYQYVYDLVRQVPPGRVVTYGQVAALLGSPQAARAVGYALRFLPAGSEVPWHRVINHQGQIERQPLAPCSCRRPYFSQYLVLVL